MPQQTAPPVADPAAGISVRDVVERLAAVPGREERLTHLEVLPARAAVEAEWPLWVPGDVRAAFEARGLRTPWRHQVEAAEAAHDGRHVVMATGTASGKSLGYQLPTLAAIRSTRGPRQQRGAATLYLSPTKALAQDQLAGLESLGLDVRFSTHDGDSPREQREWTRDHAEYVLTNPDMLHRSLLPAHHRWAQFLGSLRYVVVDECHHYRGVFGAHVAQVLRRLRRVCAAYGAHPTFVLASATVAEPEVHAHRLTGLDVLPVVDDASPRARSRSRSGSRRSRPTPASTARPYAARRRPRPPTCWPTWSSRACARSPSSGRGAGPSTSR